MLKIQQFWAGLGNASRGTGYSVRDAALTAL